MLRWKLLPVVTILAMSAVGCCSCPAVAFVSCSSGPFLNMAATTRSTTRTTTTPSLITTNLYSSNNSNNNANSSDDNDSSSSLNDNQDKDLDRQFYQFLQGKEEQEYNVKPRTQRKFTGQRSREDLVSQPPTSSLFSSEPTTTTTSSALDREREREFNLASTFGRSLPIQAAVLAFSAAFMIYVGVTGGITDGSDRNWGDMDLVLEEQLSQNIVVPQPNSNAIRMESSSSSSPPASLSSSNYVWL